MTSSGMWGMIYKCNVNKKKSTTYTRIRLGLCLWCCCLCCFIANSEREGHQHQHGKKYKHSKWPSTDQQSSSQFLLLFAGDTFSFVFHTHAHTNLYKTSHLSPELYTVDIDHFWIFRSAKVNPVDKHTSTHRKLRLFVCLFVLYLQMHLISMSARRSSFLLNQTPSCV